MWSRTILIMLGLWLLGSPYIFGDQSVSDGFYTWNGLILTTLSCFSVSKRFEKTAILVFIHCLFLFLWGRFAYGYPHPPGAQNLTLAGLIGGMIVVIPLRDQEPPWEEEKGMTIPLDRKGE